MDDEVRKYLDRQKPPQKKILEELREIILTTYPGISEKMWVGAIWYDRNYYIVGLKDHVNIGFCMDKLSVNEQALFEGHGKLMRHIKIYPANGIDRRKLIELLKITRVKGSSGMGRNANSRQ